MHPPALAVAVTYRRPRLAGDVVRRLVADEGLAPSNIILVINGDGGLDDSELEARVDTVRLPQNTGPAGGFRAGLVRASGRMGSARWVYLCEDDIGLFDLPRGRLGPLITAVEAVDRGAARRVGAVFAYGRDLRPRTGITVPHEPSRDQRFDPVDVACWGASLVSRRVLDARILPDDRWFFGYEDFDFWLQIADAGFSTLLDTEAARSVAALERDDVFIGERPLDAEEGWRSYYVARNFLELARRHGHIGWSAWHLVKSLRRYQRASSSGERRAIVRGLADGYRRRLGVNPAYVREIGEV
jgi:GT2 family glycosyltransferase